MNKIKLKDGTKSFKYFLNSEIFKSFELEKWYGIRDIDEGFYSYKYFNDSLDKYLEYYSDGGAVLTSIINYNVFDIGRHNGRRFLTSECIYIIDIIDVNKLPLIDRLINNITKIYNKL